jgi:hypothetical protein
MPTPRFQFTQYEKSFKVYVENLELLSVEQIQELELFVKKRKGVFDFHSYTFIIQKKINFEEFTYLLKELGLHAICSESFLPLKNEPRIAFGEYKGMFYSELPLSYLLWLQSNYFGPQKDTLDREVEKRNK